MQGAGIGRCRFPPLMCLGPQGGGDGRARAGGTVPAARGVHHGNGLMGLPPHGHRAERDRRDLHRHLAHLPNDDRLDHGIRTATPSLDGPEVEVPRARRRYVSAVFHPTPYACFGTRHV